MGKALLEIDTEAKTIKFEIDGEPIDASDASMGYFIDSFDGSKHCWVSYTTIHDGIETSRHISYRDQSGQITQNGESVLSYNMNTDIRKIEARARAAIAIEEAVENKKHAKKTKDKSKTDTMHK